jgi:hypothetical protein
MSVRKANELEPNVPNTPDPNDATQPQISQQSSPHQPSPLLSIAPYMDQARQRGQAVWQGANARMSNWPSAARIAAIAGAALISLCIVCSLCSVGLAALGGGSGSNTTLTNATDTPKLASATSAPAAKATNTPSGPAKVKGPYLDGSESDFQAAFGKPDYNFKDTRHYQATIDGKHVLVVAFVTANANENRVRFLRIAPSDQGAKWNATTGNAMAKRFLPPDAKYQKDKQTQDVGTEHVYVSQQLGASLPASSFIDIDTNAALAAGTFNYYCGGGINAADGGCALLPGA